MAEIIFLLPFSSDGHTKQKKNRPESDANCGYMCSRLGSYI